MKTALIAAIILLLAHAAFAQDKNEQWVITGDTRGTSSAAVMNTFRNIPAMVTITTETGIVTINWSAVEQIAVDPNHYDKTSRVWAQVMLAIRDKTYTEIKDEPK